ncbi:MAG: type I DNA topoisomerase [Patescibacteria group bacterium]
MRTLVIVESPTKAKTISKFLGKDYIVESSFGHVRDLPKSHMGVDIEGGTFAPAYEIPDSKKKRVTELRKLAKSSDDILFASDEDREGEAISWHLAELLKIDPSKVKRLVFHEITKTAIEHAIKNPRELNMNLVDAQQARRVLDRLVGYELSPLLWKKVRYGLSAGRVQSVAVDLIVGRELERARFKSSAYFDLTAKLETGKDSFTARLLKYEEKIIPAGKDFDENTGKIKKPENFALLNEEAATLLAKKLLIAKPWLVSEISETPYQAHPYPPFITSTLQQEASRKYGWAARQTMRTAQSLYENGYITYMRTDSVNLSDQAISAARQAAREFGDEYLSASPKIFISKSKLAQEAHEAIRPAGSQFKHPSDVAREVSSEEAKLYDMIWKRTVACQMKNAEMITMSVKINIEKAVFESKGKRIKFAGFMRAYVEGSDDPEAELENQEIHLPNLKEKQEVKALAVDKEGHATQPPARYTEASLIKKLEAEGVGRPSTYATILDTITEREYAVKLGQALVPTYTAMITDHYLKKYFSKLVDVHFTSKMEDDLDMIAEGNEKWIPYIKNFYQGGEDSFHTKVRHASEAEGYPTLEIGEDAATKKPLVIKSGKYGPYIQRGEGGENNTASIPDNIPPAELNLEKALMLLSQPQGPQVIIKDPETGKEITRRTGRYGPYMQLGEDEPAAAPPTPRASGGRSKTTAGKEKKAKKVALTYGPKHLPISKTFNLDTITPELAIRIAHFPLVIGESKGEKIIASVGKFGPYLKKGDDFRSIPKEKDILTITLAEAEEIYAEEKKSRRKKSTVLREFGADPETGKPVQALEGPYGPYVSNGTRNFGSIPKDTKLEEITLAQALELLKQKKGKKKAKKN